MSTAIQWRDMTHTAQQIDAAVDAANSHIADSSVHMTAAEKTKLAGLENYDDTEVRGLIAAKQDALTFDQTPTENSQNPVYSGGVFPLQNALATIIDATYKQNVLENTAETATIGEVTFTVNSDGSVTAVTNSATTANRSLSFIATVPAGTWWFSTNQPLSGGSSAPCYCAINKSGTARCNDFNPDKQVLTVDETTNFQFVIVIRSGVAAGTTLTFYPMLCLKKWYDVSPAYIPYSSGT